MTELPIQLHKPLVKSEDDFVLVLKNKFILFTDSQMIERSYSENIWQQIFTAHNVSSRAYHNLSHLYSITEIFDQFLISDLNQTILYWTTFFHDYIYKATRKDNETKSALIAKEVLTPVLSTDLVQTITTFIESTAQHKPLMDIPEQLAFLDADLAILATNENLYDQYTEAIRREYWMYPDLLYRLGRKKVLQHFLERTHIYYTPIFKEYEAQARANLQREMAGLL